MLIFITVNCRSKFKLLSCHFSGSVVQDQVIVRTLEHFGSSSHKNLLASFCVRKKVSETYEIWQYIILLNETDKMLKYLCLGKKCAIAYLTMENLSKFVYLCKISTISRSRVFANSFWKDSTLKQKMYVNVFSRKVLIVWDTIFTSPTGDGTAI